MHSNRFLTFTSSSSTNARPRSFAWPRINSTRRS
jgi:hypothetical protein